MTPSVSWCHSCRIAASVYRSVVDNAVAVFVIYQGYSRLLAVVIVSDLRLIYVTQGGNQVRLRNNPAQLLLRVKYRNIMYALF